MSVRRVFLCGVIFILPSPGFRVLRPRNPNRSQYKYTFFRVDNTSLRAELFEMLFPLNSGPATSWDITGVRKRFDDLTSRQRERFLFYPRDALNLVCFGLSKVNLVAGSVRAFLFSLVHLSQFINNRLAQSHKVVVLYNLLATKDSEFIFFEIIKSLSLY